MSKTNYFVDNDDLYIRRLTGSTFAEWRQIVIHSGNIGGQSVNYATTTAGLRLIQQSYLVERNKRWLECSTSTGRGVSTSAYISFIMQQIQLELDIYNLMLAASRISVQIVQPCFAVNGDDS
jgi:hypothetical protein